jgi:cyclopropane fatty-acyl-phospholipid synthase-like methyltransferase
VDDFDVFYGSTPDYFGAEPEASLVRFADLLDLSQPVLDVGCGQGRNTLFLARRGFSVDALDPSRVAVEQVGSLAEKNGLSVRTIHGTFQDLKNGDHRYGGILLFGLIPLLSRSEIADLALFVMSHLETRGILFATAFGTWDPDCPHRAGTWRKEDENSFRSPDGRLRTYLEPGELTALFQDLSPVHSWEGMTPEHRHGDGPSERHGLAEAVLQRR